MDRHYNIFLNYRRNPGRDFARTLKQALELRGYSVFFDYDSLQDGEFNKEIFSAIDTCDVFVLTYSRDSLDRCANEGDWVRTEIEYAQSRGKKIVPVAQTDTLTGWIFPANIPSSLSFLLSLQISEIHTGNLFDESIDKFIAARFPRVLQPSKRVNVRERIIRWLTGRLPYQNYADAASVARAIRRRRWQRNIVLAVLACGAALLLLRVVPSALEMARDKLLPPPSPIRTIELPGGATMDMVWCPPGTFTMGSPEDEAGRNADEAQHEVTLEEGFWLAKTEVTQRQWESVMGNRPADNMGRVSVDEVLAQAFSVKNSSPYPSSFDADGLPVERVSWNDCQEFCRKTGLQLPTEAQWEYACRAGSPGPFAGNGKPDKMGWYENNSRYQTHPVGRKSRNAWGFRDMHGNVAEWCADRWNTMPGTAGSSREQSASRMRVVRGGSCWDPLEGCRSAKRRGIEADVRDNRLGFRPMLPGTESSAGNEPTGGVAAAEATAPPPERKAAAAESAPKPFRNTIAGLLDDLVPVPGQADRIARHEVTQAQWRELMGDNPSRTVGDDLPVDSATLLAYLRFLDRLNALPAVKKRGFWFRLPFANEWKKAASRPGTIEHHGTVRELTMSRCYDIHNGYFCMALDADGGVTETVSSSVADWKPGPNGYVRDDDALPLGFRVCVDAAPRLPGR